jgi:hypothetical protein
MGRPRLIATQEILEAARDIFLGEAVGATLIKLDLVLTARDERGNTFIASDGRRKVSAMLMGLGHMLKRYCETGEMLKLEHQAQVQ